MVHSFFKLFHGPFTMFHKEQNFNFHIMISVITGYWLLVTLHIISGSVNIFQTLLNITMLFPHDFKNHSILWTLMPRTDVSSFVHCNFQFFFKKKHFHLVISDIVYYFWCNCTMFEGIFPVCSRHHSTFNTRFTLWLHLTHILELLITMTPRIAPFRKFWHHCTLLQD